MQKKKLFCWELIGFTLDGQRRTGGMVIWRAGSVMVVYRGRDYQGSSAVFNQMARPEETLSRTFSAKCAGVFLCNSR